jgi:hypothetical protein
MNGPATARPPGRSRLALLVAGVLALLGSFAVTKPAQAGYYDDSYYGGYRYSPDRYAPYRDDRACSACGCWRRCHSASRPGLVYERRYVEREYVERRYGWPARHYHRHYGYRPYGGYQSWARPYRRHYGNYPDRGYRSWSRPYPWGYGGVRGWRAPYSDRYQPSADRYVEQPRPPAPRWQRAGYDAVSYGHERAHFGDESRHWNAGQSWPHDATMQAPVASGVAAVSQLLPRGPVGMIASGLLGLLNVGPP